MTSNGGDRHHGGDGVLGYWVHYPAVTKLGEAARDYAKAQGGDVARRVGQRVSAVTDSLTEKAENGGLKATAAGQAVKRVAGAGSGLKEKAGELLGRKKSGDSGGDKKFVSIIEDIAVGVPVNVAYDQWTQFQEFASFMRGVETVDQSDDTNSNWRVKVAKSRRNFKAT